MYCSEFLPRINPDSINFLCLNSSYTKESFFIKSSLTHKSNVNISNQDFSFLKNQIKLIATDVDGTLLNSKQQLTNRTENALKKAMENGIKVVIATGKARGPWVKDIFPRLNTLTPSIFLQGLLIYDPDDSLVYERLMDENLAMDLCHLAEKENLTHIAYCDDRILCEKSNFHTDRLIGYGEPIPEEIGRLKNIIGKTNIHKILYMGDDVILKNLRPNLEKVLGERATVVTALTGMLEILPRGASKAVGLGKVLEILNIDSENVMAIGDGENDIEMLKMSGFAIAMGNSSREIQNVSDFVAKTNDEDGLAIAIEQFLLN